MLRLTLAWIVSFLLFLSFPLAVHAQSNFRSGELVSLGANEIVKQDYFAAGSNVTLDGTVNGDAYLVGGNVTVNGTVNGDLLVAGGNLNINGVVTGNVRGAGGNVTLSGKVGRNVSVATGTLILSPSADLLGNLIMAGGQVEVASKINGNVTAAVGRLSLSSLAKVNGKVDYWSDTPANISSLATISGGVTQYVPPKQTRPEPRPEVNKTAMLGAFSMFKFLGFLTTLIIGWVWLRFFPNYSKRLSLSLTTLWLPNLGWGFLALALTPFVILFLLVSIIGIPVIFAWLIFLGFALWLAKIFVALAIGEYLGKYFKKDWNIYLTFLVGLVVFSIINMIPVLGWIFSCVTGLIALGAILLLKKQYYVELSEKKII